MPIMFPMHKKIFHSTLYHLIEAGQLARLALLRPLTEYGLHGGDDALILAMKKHKKISDNQICHMTGLTPQTLQPRLDRLIALGIVERKTLGTELTPGSKMTKKGRVIRKKLIAHWRELEDALMHDLPQENKTQLRHTIKRFADLLSL